MPLLIPQFTESQILKFFKFFSFLNAYPIHWNWENEKIVEPLKPGVRSLIYYGIAFKCWIYWPYLVITLWNNLEIYLEQRRFAHLVIHSTWTASYGVALAAHYPFCCRRKQMVEYVNQTVNISKQVEAFYKVPFLEKAAKIRNFIVGSIFFYTVFELSLSPFLFFTFYDQDWYIFYQVLPAGLKKFCVELKWPLAIVSALTTYIEATAWGACFCASYCTLMYVQNVFNILKVLGNQLCMKHRDRKEFYTSIRIYSKLRILNTIFNQAVCDVAWPFCIALSYGLFIGGFCAVFTETGSLLAKFIGGFFMMVAFTVLLATMILFAQVHTASFNFHEKILLHRPIGKHASILCNSYKNIAVDYGIFFEIKKQTLFTLLDQLSDTAISTVLYIS